MDSETGPRLRFTLHSPSAGETPWQPLASKPELKRTSYFIVKNESKDFEKTKKVYKITTGDFEDGGHGNPDFIVGIHLQSSGSVFIESLHPTQEVYLARGLSRLAKRLLPRSKPPTERMLVLLDSDATISINDEIINFQIGSSENFTPASAVNVGGDVATEEGSEDVHVLVQQSHPQDILRRGESDLAQSTPAVPKTIQEEPKVYETPSIRSRFMNPDSAKVTLPRNLPREDTFGGFDGTNEPTPRRNKSGAKSFVASTASNGLIFGGHNSGMPGEITSQLSAMDDANLSTSDEEVEEVVQSNRLFKPSALAKKTVLEIDLTESMSESEVPTLVKTVPLANMTQGVSSVTSPEVIEDDDEENRGSQAESMRRQFSESAMITSFTSVISEGISKDVSPIAEDEEEVEAGKGKLPNKANTPVNRIKRQGVPEGFLYEEHKKDTTPKQTYGKKKRRSGPKFASKSKRTSAGTVSSGHSSENEVIEGVQAARSNERKSKAAQKVNDTDEGEEEEEVPSRRTRRKIAAEEEEDTVMETADDEDETVPPPRTQGRRGRRTVVSQPDSTAGVTEDIAEEKRSGMENKLVSPQEAERLPSEQDEEEPNAEEKEAELASTAKPTVRPMRGRRGAKKLSDASETVFNTAPEVAPEVASGTKPTRTTRKRQRAPGDIAEDDEGPDQPMTREGTAESTIQVTGQPKPKRVKAAPAKKVRAKRGNKKDVTPSPPQSGQNEKVLGDTQYTFQDVTQTQSLDHVEVKTPRTAKKKAAPPPKRASTTAPARKKKADSQPQQTDEEVEADDDDETDEGRTRTRDRYEGDSPKIVFSNSGLDERKDIEKFLRANGGRKMQNVSVPGVNFLVVGPGELKRTPKLTVGVALGKYVVEDQWLIDSKEVGYFLDPDPYIPHDPTHEKAWNFSLQAAIERGRKGENCVLKDHNIYITSSLLSQLKQSKQEESLVEMLKAAGAGTITKKAPKGRKEDDEHALILGTEKGDSDVPALEKAGWTVYGTGIVAISVLRGKLEGGDEFRIVTEVGGKEVSQKAGRGRKGK